MLLHRLDADLERVGDLLIGEPHRHQSQYLRFPGRERHVDIVGECFVCHRTGHAAEIPGSRGRFVACGIRDRLDDCLSGGGLEHVVGGSGRDGAGDVGGAVERGKHHDPGVGAGLTDRLDRVEPVAGASARTFAGIQPDIERDDVGPELAGQLHRFRCIRCLSHDGDLGILEDAGQPLTDDFMVVRDQDANPTRR